MRRSGYARCEAWKSHDLGLQVSHRVDHEVPISGDGRRCGAEGPRTATRNCAGSRDEDLCRVDQSGSCAYADWDPTASAGVTSGAIPQGEKLGQTSVGISIASQRYWGQHLWGRGYWVATSGNVTDEVWAEYIKNQTAPEPDDDFKVT